MRGVDGDVDEDVEGGDLGRGDRYQAGVRVVHEQVTAQSASGVVIDAAGAVGDVAHDEGFASRTELGEDVGDGGCEQEETFRELKGHTFGTGRADPMDCFGDLERVVGR